MSVPDAQLANAIRALSMDAVEAANSGHPGMPMGMADVATVLFTRYLRYDPADPQWIDRDRFVLSAGHGSMLIYSLLHLTGYARPTIEDISNFRQLGSPCAGHPENFELPGIECTTGPLGQGVAMAVGMAIAERHLNADFGDALVDHRTWVIAGDGCLMEGVNHEAIGLAGHLGLGRLIVLWDDNRITIDGSTDLSTSEDIPARYRATGWHVVECDGHDFADISRAFDEAIAEDARPTLVRCRTIIGKGAPNKGGSHKVHGSPLGKDEIAATREALVWESEPFALPDEIRDGWLEAGRAAAEFHTVWKTRAAGEARVNELRQRMAGDFDADAVAQVALDDIARGGAKVATRKSSELVLEKLTSAYPALVGGSADLTPSNNTQVKATATAMVAGDYAGRYIHYGIREFGMAAAMNGMALHGGVVPYGGTFLVFSDYARPAIRLAALQHARTIFVMTHDSIGLGEDGPTHQPIEHVMSLRLIPQLDVWRPCDSVETAEAWACAVARKDGPSLIALTRQNLRQVREAGAENLSAKGGYRLRAASAERKVVLIASGSEVEIALDVADALEAAGVGADVVSMPCWSRFDAQAPEYRDDVLPPVGPEQVLRVSIEAGTTIGWERYTMVQGLRFGIDRFGASAPAPELYDYFGLTAAKITPQVLAKLKEMTA